jgi:MoaA/NifB/PqqE/SkfB family radical SAM enzyme
MAGQLFMDGTKLNRHLEEVVKWKNGDWFAPIHMEISVTNRCNQRCVFCYIDWNKGHFDMPEEMAVRLIRDAKAIGVKSALIAGEGEPTLNKNYIKMIEAAQAVDFDIALNTNAVLMDLEDLNRILPGLAWMRCSVQAGNPGLYSRLHGGGDKQFARAIDNIATAVKTKQKLRLNVTIGIQQVLLAENGHDAANLARLARDIGVDYYVIKPCHPHARNRYKKEKDLVACFREVLEEAQGLSTGSFKSIVRWNFLNEAELPRSYKKCLALPFIMQITADGGCYSCYAMADRSEHLYGSLQVDSLKEIVTRPRFKEVCDWVRDNVDVSKCMPTCRHHNANKYLWWLEEEIPSHLNFI